VPFDDRPTIRDRYRPLPPDQGSDSRQRRRYERDLVRITPRPAQPQPPGNRGPGDGIGTNPRGPIARPSPKPGTPSLRPVPTRPGVTPRYRIPNRQPAAIATPRLQPGNSLSGRGNGGAGGRGRRNEASWTFGRGDRVFHGKHPWGVNASGSRIYGYWGRWCSPHSFAWCHVPSWCRWGFYSWPAYCGYYWPRYSWWCNWSSAWWDYSWSAWDPYCVSTYRPWYWPTSVYAPTSVYLTTYDDGAYDADVGHVTIRVGDEGGADIRTEGDAVRVSVGSGAKVSKETLAERHVQLADNHFREGRYQDSADNYLRALSFLPDDASIHFALADALFALGDYHYAAFMIGKGLDLDPDLATLVVDKRTFYGEPATFLTQLDTLRRYTQEQPYDAAAFVVLGYNLRFSGDDAGAERAFSRVLEIDKHNQAAELFLAAIRTSKTGASTDRK